MKPVVVVAGLVAAFVVVTTANAAHAAEKSGVPAPLQPWVPWVLEGSERELCPAKIDGTKVCESPGKLELVVEKTGGTFTEGWRVDAGGLVQIIGDDKHWPLDVNVDGHAAVVIERGGVPLVQLPAGEHVLKGRLAWDTPPESIAIPAATAAVRLVVGGREVPFIDRGDAGDRVWLKRDSSGEEREEDRLDVAVFRKIVDGVPLLLDTQVLIEVSGKGREVVIPSVLLDGFTALSVSSSLPARIDSTNANGLRVQVRPGRHTITVLARRDADDRVLKAPAQMNGDEEVWVYEANHAVRVANVTGVPSIVAEQTRLPDAWRALPAYRVLPGESVTLEQQKRGDESPPPSQLNLVRTMWLDFNGKGFTVHDEIGGRFTGDRLLMGPDTKLGRVSTGDAAGDAFITKDPSDKSGGSGVEVRSPNLRVSADSRIDAGAGDFPAVSWAHDFQSVTELVHLPPGYRLLHASGVDDVQSTWVKSWSLFQIFLVVVLTLAMGRLFGVPIGAATLVTLVLTFQEENAPRAVWIVVVVFAALHKVMPPAWETRVIAKLLRWCRFLTAIVAAIVGIVFVVHQVRVGMYPVLEQPDRRVGDGQLWGQTSYGAKDIINDEDVGILATAKLAEPAQTETTVTIENGLANGNAINIPKVPVAKGDPNAFEDGDGKAQAQQFKIEDKKESGEYTRRAIADQIAQSTNNAWSSDVGSASNPQSGYYGKIGAKRQKLQKIDPTSVVQTGPGLPQWGFTTVRLVFSGPVTKDQHIQLMLLGPKVNLALAFLRVLLVAFLVVVAFGMPGSAWPPALLRAFRGKGALYAGSLLVLATSLFASSSRADEPSQEALNELRARLLKPADCNPDCASIARISLDADDARLRLRAEVHAQAPVAIPLPGADKQWSVSTIVVDGKAAAGAFREGNALWVVLSPGRHDVVLEGALPSRDSVQLAFPMVPHHASFASSVWTLDGVHEDGVPDANLQLNRRAKGSGAAHATDDGGGASGEALVLPPFLSVERSLLLGISFEVETRVTRISPPGTPVVIEVPLLPGENVTTEGVRVEGKKALVSLGPNDTEVSWSGVVATTDHVELIAATNVPYVEVWNLEASPVWHVEETGIPPLHDETPRSGGARSWRPWPGEKLSLVVTRPQGVPGQTVTIERTSQSVRPGLRSTDVTLTVDMRASRGGEHVITIPDGSELLSATINGTAQPLRPQKGKVTVPLVPGKQQVVLTVRVPTGIATVFHPPQFDVAQANVNAEIVVDVPHDRWILFATGPRAGPAVLFWSYLVVLILAGFGLSRVPFSPLKFHHWVLLGFGLTQVELAVAVVIAAWLLALGWRKNYVEMGPGWFNLRQMFVATMTVIGVVLLGVAIHAGLLGAPDMVIAGNGSSETSLRWFADHSDASLPSSTVLTLPMMAYRLAMLAWALWLAYALLKWLRFGWAAFAEGGMWRALPKPPPRPKPGMPGAPSSSSVPEAGAPTSAAVPSTSPVPPKT